MSSVRIRGYGSVVLDEKDTRSLDTTKPIRVGEIYRDDSLEIGE